MNSLDLKKKPLTLLTIFVSTSLFFSISNALAGAQGGGGGGSCKDDFMRHFEEVYENIYAEDLGITWRLKYNLTDVIENMAELLNDDRNGVRINPVEKAKKMQKCPNENSEAANTACAIVKENVIELNCDEKDQNSWWNISKKLKLELVLHELFYWFDGSSDVRVRINDANMFRSRQLVEQMPIQWPLVEVDPNARISVSQNSNGIVIHFPQVLVGSKLMNVLRHETNIFNITNSAAGVCALYGYAKSDILDYARMRESYYVDLLRNGRPNFTGYDYHYAIENLVCWDFVGRDKATNVPEQ